jgi:hypothetical protein
VAETPPDFFVRRRAARLSLIASPMRATMFKDLAAVYEEDHIRAFFLFSFKAERMFRFACSR